jgi:NAD(P)-dependent dehydrogenase (short-subunit alcohol dehydrogenase family)
MWTPLNTPIRDWHGRKVWLVGASSGIGLAIAEALHAAGATVVVSARRAEALDAFVQQHPGAHAVALDVCDTDAVARATERVAQEVGLDVVVYCAGYYKAERAFDAHLESWLQHQDINYQGALRVIAHVVQRLQPGAHISLIASVAAYRGLPLCMGYSPTKAALNNLADVMYLDLSTRGIGVSVINPGFVATPLTAQNEFHMPALMTPKQAAQAVLQGWAKGEFEIHFPRRFSRFLKLMRLLPNRWYFALTRRASGL